MLLLYIIFFICLFLNISQNIIVINQYIKNERDPYNIEQNITNRAYLSSCFLLGYCLLILISFTVLIILKREIEPKYILVNILLINLGIITSSSIIINDIPKIKIIYNYSGITCLIISIILSLITIAIYYKIKEKSNDSTTVEVENKETEFKLKPLKIDNGIDCNEPENKFKIQCFFKSMTTRAASPKNKKTDKKYPTSAPATLKGFFKPEVTEEKPKSSNISVSPLLSPKNLLNFLSPKEEKYEIKDNKNPSITPKKIKGDSLKLVSPPKFSNVIKGEIEETKVSDSSSPMDKSFNFVNFSSPKTIFKEKAPVSPKIQTKRKKFSAGKSYGIYKGRTLSMNKYNKKVENEYNKIAENS